MANFITRVELHYGTSADYEVLHREMTERRFLRTVRGDDGKVYNLPSATYFSFGPELAETVRDYARAAAEVTGRKHWVLTTRYDQAAWLLNDPGP